MARIAGPPSRLTSLSCWPDHLQPWAQLGPLGVEEHHVQEGVVDLPLRVGTLGRVPQHQLEPVLVSVVPVLGQSAQSGIDLGDQAPDAGVDGAARPRSCEVSDAR